MYVLDKPTTGLHLADVDKILGLLDRLVDAGKTVIVIEHHQAVMAHADWIIDIGPGAGHDGGKIVFEGTPTDLVSQKSTLTGSTSQPTSACERSRGASPEAPPALGAAAEVASVPPGDDRVGARHQIAFGLGPNIATGDLDHAVAELPWQSPALVEVQEA